MTVLKQLRKQETPMFIPKLNVCNRYVGLQYEFNAMHVVWCVIYDYDCENEN